MRLLNIDTIVFLFDSKDKDITAYNYFVLFLAKMHAYRAERITKKDIEKKSIQ